MIERRDIDPGRIVAIGAGIAVLAVCTLFAMHWLLLRFERQQMAARPAAHALTATEPEREPPAPRLQERPIVDLQMLRAREQAQLSGYAWVDRDAGRVRIPIERAMELVAKDGVR
ncbi:MAG TPA: hypothetical protein VNO26_08130 [Candidatus Limnocylindria bacterium]|nr:hypothetical protein [Candidatus Limnocylindria bacterium]